MDESIVKYFERPTELRPAGEVQQKVGRLKLSEAIRRGAALRPQCRTVFWSDGGSCAMGAAFEAIGIPYGSSQDFTEVFIRNFPSAFREALPDIFVRNDSGESRESIAAWLESKGL